MSYNLYLDDFREPMDSFMFKRDVRYNKLNWVIVRNYDEFVQIIEENGIPEVVSFDHDLAYVHYDHQNKIDYSKFIEKTGYHCAKWLISYCLDNDLEFPSEVLIHSMNVQGSENIKSLFHSVFKKV